MEERENLANILWRSLSGSHRHLATGTDRIRRYARGYSPLIGYADPSSPDFAALAAHCEAGERFYCAEWQGPEPAGWKVEVDTSMCAMLWNGATPAADPALGAVRLTRDHVPEMMALAAITRPGPFAERTFELGDFYGVVEEGRLVAMAGERMHAGSLREVSGVCTAPDRQGRGLAKRLTELIVRIQLARGQIPFLHVTSSNTRARALYERLGFRLDREVPLRIVLFGEARA
jgi:ribosomal protein S18 acetylase RimI-like enzyme